MSKKKRKRKSTYQRRYKKPLIKGKFYRIRDSNGGHPSRLFRKNTKKNKYWIVRFTSSPGRHRTKLKHQIDPQRDGDSFVINNPTIEKYEDFSSPYPLDNLRVHKDDLKIVREIQKKKRWDPRAGNNAAPSESIIVYIFNQNEGDDAISKHINAQFAATQIFIQ